MKKEVKKKMVWGVRVQLVEYFASMHEALGSIPNIA